MKTFRVWLCLATCLSLLLAADAWATPTVVNVKDCYASGSSTDDDALHAAVNVAQGIVSGFGSCGVPGGAPVYIGAVYVPPGQYELRTTLTITKPLSITGVRGSTVSGLGSRIYAASTNPPAIMIEVKTTYPVLITDLLLNAAAQQLGSSAILVHGNPLLDPPPENEIITLERISIWNAQTGIKLESQSKATIRSCFIKNFIEAGIDVENAFHVDRGDGLIEGCWIAYDLPGPNHAVGIDQSSSGGLKVIGNKIVGPMSVGYRLKGEATSGPTGILIIDGNSFEAQSSSNISLSRGNGLLTFGQVVISNNQLDMAPQGILVVDDTPAHSPQWLRALNITGNSFLDHSSASISLYEVDQVMIASNTFHGTFPSLEPIGIYLNPNGGGGFGSPTNVRIGPNSYVNVITHISDPGGLATLCPPSSCN